MKTYEEMAENALRRIGEEKAIQRKRRQTVRKIAAPALSLCLIAALGFGVWKSGLLRAQTPAPDAGLAQAFGGPELPMTESDVPQEASQLPVEAILIPDAGETTEPALATPGDFKDPDFGTQGSVYLWWNKLSVSGALYHAIEAERERSLPERMTALLKQGDELKYGAALCETGTPDGFCWDNNLYENQVSFIGEELLSRYIVDGVFLRDELEADIAALPAMDITTPDGTTTAVYNGENGARKQYARAYAAYLESILPGVIADLEEAGIECARAAYSDSAISVRVSAEELENLPLEHPEWWYFDLAVDGRKDSAEPVTDAAGLTVVN